jgi:hypothetical protein
MRRSGARSAWELGRYATHRSAGWTALAAALFFTAGCSELATLPADVQMPSSARLEEQHAGAANTAFPCYTSTYVVAGAHRYRYGSLLLHFPASALAPDGRKRQYRLFVGGENGIILMRANCLIPATRSAVELTNRWFGVERPGGPPAASIAATDFTLDPVEVTACPSGYTGSYPDCKRDASGSSGSTSPTEVPSTGGSSGTGTGDSPNHPHRAIRATPSSTRPRWTKGSRHCGTQATRPRTLRREKSRVAGS